MPRGNKSSRVEAAKLQDLDVDWSKHGKVVKVRKNKASDVIQIHFEDGAVAEFHSFNPYDGENRTAMLVISAFNPSNGERAEKALIRVRAVWSDREAGVVYLLQKYVKGQTFLKCLAIGGREKWVTTTPYTTDKEKAEAWANHYAVEIEYESGL